MTKNLDVKVKEESKCMGGSCRAPEHVHNSFPPRLSSTTRNSYDSRKPDRELFVNHTTDKPSSTNRQNGSSSQQRQGYLLLRHPLLAHRAVVAQGHPRPGRRSDLQGRQKGRHAFADRCAPPRQPWCRPGQDRDRKQDPPYPQEQWYAHTIHPVFGFGRGRMRVYIVNGVEE